MNFKQSILWALGVSVLAGCGGKNGKSSDKDAGGSANVTVKMQNISSAASIQNAFTRFNMFSNVPSILEHTLTGSGKMSFTPTSYRYPIVRMSLVSENGDSVPLYTCDPSTDSDECYVNLMDASEVSSKIVYNGTEGIKAGTYKSITVETCDASKSSSTPSTAVKIEGSFTYSSTTYYTRQPAAGNSYNAITSDSSLAEPVSINFDGGCATSTDLETPLTVAEGETPTLTLSVFLSLDNITWGQTQSESVIGGCSATYTSTAPTAICSSYPAAFPYIGTQSPTVELYQVAENPSTSDVTDTTTLNTDLNKAHGLFLMLVGENGEPMTGFSRRFYRDSTVTGKNFDCGVQRLKKNDDDTYLIETWGSTGSVDAGYWQFNSFNRLNVGALALGTYYAGETGETVSSTSPVPVVYKRIVAQ